MNIGFFGLISINVSSTRQQMSGKTIVGMR